MATPCLTCGTVIDNDECQCSFADSPSITMQGSGRTNPFVAVGNLDPDDDNLWTCEGDGNLVQLPAYVLNPPRCQAYNSTNQSIANDDEVVVALDSEYFDTDTMHDTVTLNSRLTVVTAGIYVITFSGTFASNTTGDREALLRKNGSDYIAGSEKRPPSGAFESSFNVYCQEYLRVGEYVEAIVKQDSGGALNLLATRYSPIVTALFRRKPPDE